MTPCEHLQEGVCGIASQMAGQAVTPHASACKFCAEQGTPPRAINRITVSIAVASLSTDSPIRDKLLAEHVGVIPRSPKSELAAQRLAAVLAGIGVGSQLWRLLSSLGIEHREDCECLTWAERMNAWGPEGCREARQEIATHMRDSAKSYGWGAKLGAAAMAVATGLAWRVNLSDPYGSILDEAINLAELAGAKPAVTVPAKPQPKRLILTTDLPPGDILTLTAAVESLHATYPGEYLTDVRTKHPAIWQGNPHITKLADKEPGVLTIPMHYHEGPASINKSNEVLAPFLGAYTDWLARAIGRPLRLTVNRPCVYLSDQERAEVPSVISSDPRPSWLVCAGIKSDWTTKQWPVEYYQEVIDKTKDVIHWVQIGLKQHDHPQLDNVTSLLHVGPPMRELLVLAYHAAGGLGPITFLQHVCAAFNKPYCAIVGGREPPAWVQYQRQWTFHTMGQLDCCRTRACWRMRVLAKGDNATVGSDARKRKTDSSLCSRPLKDQFSRPVADCMAMITPAEVIPVLNRLSVVGKT